MFVLPSTIVSLSLQAPGTRRFVRKEFSLSLKGPTPIVISKKPFTGSLFITGAVREQVPLLVQILTEDSCFISEVRVTINPNDAAVVRIPWLPSVRVQLRALDGRSFDVKVMAIGVEGGV